MAIRFQTQRIDFRTVTGSENTSDRYNVTFPSRVLNVGTAINGFNTYYTNGDHHIKSLKIDVNPPSITDRTVTVSATILLRDDSGNIDDPYDGYVDVLLIAETVN
jgi:hypothetical protein